MWGKVFWPSHGPWWNPTYQTVWLVWFLLDTDTNFERFVHKKIQTSFLKRSVRVCVRALWCVCVSPLFQDFPAPLQNRCGEGRRGICSRATAASCLSAAHTIMNTVHFKHSCRTALRFRWGSFQASLGYSSVCQLLGKRLRKALRTRGTKCELFQFVSTTDILRVSALCEGAARW